VSTDLRDLKGFFLAWGRPGGVKPRNLRPRSGVGKVGTSPALKRRRKWAHRLR
jgi:hypothetical protein